MDPKQQQAFEEAVERKKDESEARSRAVEDPQPSLTDDGGDRDAPSVRAKNTGKGKKTADKWNQ